jgi:hypothetical protein
VHHFLAMLRSLESLLAQSLLLCPRYNIVDIVALSVWSPKASGLARMKPHMFRLKQVQLLVHEEYHSDQLLQ